MEASGRNVTEAKKEAARKLQSAMHGSYTPTILAYRGYAILIYREPQYEWHTRLIADPERGIVEGPVYGSQEGDRETAEIQARRHLAQLGWQHEDRFEVPTILAPHDRAGLSSFRFWVGFQLAYRVARGNGLPDCEAHEWACDHPVTA